MTKKQKIEIEKFIKENNLTFEYGSRNTDSVVLSGYSLYLGVNDVDKVIEVIDKVLPDADEDYSPELERVFEYAGANNYGKWWNSEEAKKEYKF